MPLFVRWEKYLGRNLDGRFFVQIGANCGTNMVECAVGGDPVWEYATRFGWKGVTVEPVARTFNKLTKNYQPYPSIKPLKAMISDHSGVGEIVLKGEMSKELGTNSTAAAVGARKVQKVPVMTLPELWQGPFAKSVGGLPSEVDVLVVDA